MGVLYCPGVFTPDKTLCEDSVTVSHLYGPWHTYKRSIF